MNFGNWKNDQVVISDIVWYYSFLPAQFVYHDITLKFKDDISIEQPKIWAEKLENGNYRIKTTIGAAILYSPFFFVAHILAEPLGYPASGYSDPYEIALLASSLFYVLLGLFFLRKLLLRYFNESVTAITLLVLTLGTNFIWFATLMAPMPHVYSFALITIFVYYTIKWHEQIHWKYSLILGITGGLFVLIRPTNVIIALFFILFQVNNFAGLKSKVQLFLPHFSQILLIILVAFMMLLPQFFYWKMVSGSWIYYSYGEKESFFFLNPQILNGLFSYRKGWILYSPVVAFGLIGIFFLRNHLKDFFVPILLFTLLNLYIIFSWWCWWYGGDIGQRSFIDSYVLLAIPMGAIVSKAFTWKKTYQYTFFTLFSLSAVFGLIQVLKHHYQSIHFDSMTKEAYFDSFFRLRPSEKFYDLLKKPDYEAAQKGIYVYEYPNYFKTNENEFRVECDMETLHPNDIEFFSKDQQYVFLGGELRSSKFSHSGKYSIELNPKNAFGLTSVFKSVRQDDKFIASVFAYCQSNNAVLVVSDYQKSFYQAKKSTSLDSLAWQKLELGFTIPSIIDSSDIKIYVWNKGNDSIYFDDLSIRKLPK